MASSICAGSGKSLLTSFTGSAQRLRGDFSPFCLWPQVLNRANPQLQQDSSYASCITAYQRSDVRIRRPSAQVSARLYAAAASEAPGVRSVPVQVAKELVDAGHHYVDVRTPEEFEGAHPEGAVNIPYMLKHGGGMTKNQDFIKEMKDQFDPDAELVIGCLSGKRSMLATTELLREEFTNVTDVGGGFQAWEKSGLPVMKSAQVA